MNKCFSECEGVFLRYGFQFKTVEERVYQIQGPYELTQRVAAQYFEAAGYCPLFSQNRVDSQLVFTLVPYVKGHGFELSVPSQRELDHESLWKMVSSVHSLREQGRPVIVNGRELFSSVEAGEKMMAEEVSKKAAFMLDLVDSVSSSGRVIDFGCGRGPNSLALLEKGWSVVGIDRFSAPLRCFRESVERIDSKLLSNLQLIEADITTVQVPSNTYDIAICVDVLPYIDSRALSSLIDKIYSSLVPGGQFFGSLFYPVKGNETPEEVLARLGAHYYPGDYFARAILKDKGFVDITCMIRHYTDRLAGCVDFRAKKPQG